MTCCRHVNGFLERRKESIMRGELEREERKKRVADFERRH